MIGARRREASKDRARRDLCLGLDASWAGIGWTIGDEAGPLAAGHVAIGARVRRFDVLRDELLGTLEDALDVWRPTLPPGRRPFVAVERPPQSHPTGGRRTVYPIGLLVGGVLLWATDPRLDLGYPWEIPTADETSRAGNTTRIGWRPWFGLQKVRKARADVSKADRERFVRMQRKTYAIQLVAASWPSIFDQVFPGWTLASLCSDEDDGAHGWDGPPGDVAESALIAHGCAKHVDEHPEPRAADRPPKKKRTESV